MVVAETIALLIGIAIDVAIAAVIMALVIIIAFGLIVAYSLITGNVKPIIYMFDVYGGIELTKKNTRR